VLIFWCVYTNRKKKKQNHAIKSKTHSAFPHLQDFTGFALHTLLSSDRDLHASLHAKTNKHLMSGGFSTRNPRAAYLNSSQDSQDCARRVSILNKMSLTSYPSFHSSIPNCR